MLINPRPFEQFNRLRDELDRVFSTVSTGTPDRFPPLNLWEDDDAFYAEAELPGMSLDDLEVTIEEGDQLRISGTRNADSDDNKVWIAKERGYGQFSRTVTLGGDVDLDAITADLRDGVLTVTVPKSEAKKPRRIKIETK